MVKLTVDPLHKFIMFFFMMIWVHSWQLVMRSDSIRWPITLNTSWEQFRPRLRVNLILPWKISLFIRVVHFIVSGGWGNCLMRLWDASVCWICGHVGVCIDCIKLVATICVMDSAPVLAERVLFGWEWSDWTNRCCLSTRIYVVVVSRAPSLVKHTWFPDDLLALDVVLS